MKTLEFISIDAWTIIFQICNLLILCLLVKKFLWKRVMAVLDARQKEIDDIYDAAGKDRQDAAQLKEDYTARMSGAREEADRLVKNAVDTAHNRGEAIVNEAKAEAAHLKQKAEGEIEQEKRKAYTELMGEISGMAADIAGRMVEREINADDHRELVEEFIKSAGLAREYGEGLYELARDEELRPMLHEQLGDIAGILKQQPQFIKLLCSRAVERSARLRIVDETFGDRVHPYVTNFMKLLVQKEHFDSFLLCCDYFHRRYNEDYGIVEAVVTSAVPLNEDERCASSCRRFPAGRFPSSLRWTPG